MARMPRLVREVHRRSLWQVLAIYVGASWAVLEAADVLIARLSLPTWIYGFAIILLLIGLPIVLATAYVQEGGPAPDDRERGTAGRAQAAGPPGEREGVASTGKKRDAPEPPSAAGADTGERHGRESSLSGSGRLREILTWRNAIAGGVLAFALWGVVAAGWVLLGGSPGTDEAGVSSLAPAPLMASERETAASVAVLPFDDMSAGEESRFFTDGVHDDILTQLSKIGDLRVVSRTSVMRYRGTGKSIRKIGEELGVDAILEGSVRRAGDQVRITTQLIDARSDDHLWAETYDRELEEVFEVQSDIARRVTNALEATLTPEEESRIARRPTESLEAYDLYLKGREHYLEYVTEENDEAIRLFRRALELDPDYALAWAGLGDAYAQRVAKFDYPREWADSAEAAARRAVELDPELAEAHKALGLALQIDGRYREALEANRRAVELDPNHDGAINNIAVIHAFQGDLDEALRWVERAFSVDPNNPFARTNIAWVYFILGDLDTAERWIRDALELDPENQTALAPWSILALRRGRVEEALERADRIVALDSGSAGHHMTAAAIAHFARRHGRALRHVREARRLAPSGDLQSWHRDETLLGYALLGQGEGAEGRAELREAVEGAREIVEAGSQSPGPLWEIASAHAALGERERALEWAERAYEAGFRSLWQVELDPIVDGLREEPRFRSLLERMRDDLREMRRRVEERRRETDREG